MCSLIFIIKDICTPGTTALLVHAPRQKPRLESFDVARLASGHLDIQSLQYHHARHCQRCLRYVRKPRSLIYVAVDGGERK